MKTLEKHTIVYDSDCPMCDLYTSAFIKAKMLYQNGRIAFSEFHCQSNDIFDRTRASNEIALIDHTNGNVIYGIDSLFKILENRFPLTRKLFKQSIIRFIAEKLYKFISFNRKVIAPAPAREQACTPSFNLRYRIAFLLIGSFFSAFILSAYTKVLFFTPGSFNSFFYLSMIIIGHLVFQYFVFVRGDYQSRFEYLGNMMSVSIIGSLLFFLMLILNSVLTISPIVATVWCILVMTFMFIEHVRRMKCLQMPVYLSATWALYLLLVSVFILTR